MQRRLATAAAALVASTTLLTTAAPSSSCPIPTSATITNHQDTLAYQDELVRLPVNVLGCDLSAISVTQDGVPALFQVSEKIAHSLSSRFLRTNYEHRNKLSHTTHTHSFCR